MYSEWLNRIVSLHDYFLYLNAFDLLCPSNMLECLNILGEGTATCVQEGVTASTYLDVLNFVDIKWGVNPIIPI